jgi:serine/threonine protein phosphatase PrpC
MKLGGHFDMLLPAEYAGLAFDLAARSTIRNEAYLLFKTTVMYSFENNEYNFIKSAEFLSTELLDQLVAALEEASEILVKPGHEHMSTTFTGVLISEQPVEPALARRIERFRRHKSYLFGLRGWSSFRLIVIDLSSGQVTSSKEAKKIAKFYLPARTRVLEEA